MIRIRGESVSPGLALGSACVVRAEGGIPLLSGVLLDRIGRHGRGNSADVLDIVLVVGRLPEAEGVTIPGTRVVAVVSEEFEPTAVPHLVPVVCGAAGVLRQVQVGELVLVDGNRGLVLIDPDASSLMAMQVAQARSVPRRRLLLDYHHLPARTLDGREMRTIAHALSAADVMTALASGADAILASPTAAGLLPEGEDWEHLEALRELADRMTGRTIALMGGVEGVSADALLRVSTEADMLLALPAAAVPAEFLNQLAYLDEQRGALLETVPACGSVRLAGVLQAMQEPAAALCEYPIGRLIILSDRRIVEAEVLGWLDELCMQAAPLMLPVEVQVELTDAASVEAAIGLGAAGLIVSPECVQAAKDEIRRAEAGRCREALLKGLLRA